MRSAKWYLAKIGYYLIGWLVRILPASLNRGSSNISYKRFIINDDPLMIKRVPIRWVTSLYRWNRRFLNYEQKDMDIYIIQGTKDKVVSWEYNISIINKKFSRVHVSYVKDAYHTLYMESNILRNKILNITGEILNN